MSLNDASRRCQPKTDDRMYLPLPPPEPETVSQSGIYVGSFFA